MDIAAQNSSTNQMAECATQAAAMPTSATMRRYSIATCTRS
jgi:hypothetical protein